MATYRVAEGGTLMAGMVATAGPGDTVMVYRSATTCPGWAVFAQAITTAFARGADVFMEPVPLPPGKGNAFADWYLRDGSRG